MTKNKKGFTLIEILMATTILVVVGVAAILVEKQFMGSGTTNKHRLEATGLAQEGISAVKATFNSKILSGDDSGIANGTYVIDGSGNLVPGPSQTITPAPGQNDVTYTRTITVGN